MSLQILSQEDGEKLLKMAGESKRKRVMHCLHKSSDVVQRMVNVLYPGTYAQPHRHPTPGKSELFCLIKGKAAVIIFDEKGKITTVVKLGTGTATIEGKEGGENILVEIPPNTYHTIVAFEPTIALEITQGPYDPLTHKSFAPWAPPESDIVLGEKYLEELLSSSILPPQEEKK